MQSNGFGGVAQLLVFASGVKSSGCGLAVKEAPELDLRASSIWPAGKREAVPTGCSCAKVRLPAQCLGPLLTSI